MCSTGTLFFFFLTHLYCVVECWSTEPGTANEKKEEIFREGGGEGGGAGGVTRGTPPSPQKILKVKTKICATGGILEANLKKCSTLKFMINISNVPSICIHRSIILIFIEKKSMLVKFSTENTFFRDFHFHENPHFRDKFQAL